LTTLYISMSRRVLVQIFAALAGGAVAAAIVLASGLGGKGKTVTMLEQAPLSATSAADVHGAALTARAIYAADAPGVVYIQSEIVQEVSSPFDVQQQQEQGEASGSGFEIDDKGDILTNNHVIAGAVKITVTLADNHQVDAQVVGRDPNNDLALLRIPVDGETLHPLALGDSKTVEVGDPTLAIGNPFGLDRTLTTGVVSALQRQITAPNGFTISNVIQTDAPINPGNSGGPLINAAGKVIGINSQIETGGNGNTSVGIGFAVPIDTAAQDLPLLEKGGTVQTTYLGVNTVTVDAGLQSQLSGTGVTVPAKSGAWVQTVESGSPAQTAGVRGGDVTVDLPDGVDQIYLGGDVIVSLDGQPIASSDDLDAAVVSHKPGDVVTLGVIRDGKSQTIKVTLGKRPASIANPNAPQSG
jgi:S1-C subfamily serine protease